MKNSNLLFILIIFLVVGAFFFFVRGDNSFEKVSDETISDENIVLSFKNFNYYPNTITVKKDETVRISLDSSVAGCYRAFTIRELNLYKYLATPQDFLEFIPTEKGTYTFACSMGMGKGTLIVE